MSKDNINEFNRDWVIRLLGGEQLRSWELMPYAERQWEYKKIGQVMFWLAYRLPFGLPVEDEKISDPNQLELDFYNNPNSVDGLLPHDTAAN